MHKCLCVILALASVSDASEDMLREPALRRFLVSVTRPDGWLRDELLLQARGLSGQLPSFWNYFNKSAWVADPSGGSTPQQFIPYYLNGLVPLSFQLDDDDTGAGAHLVAQREAYVATILNRQNVTQGAGGWLGPPVPRGSAAVDDGAGECDDECPNGNPAPAREYWGKYLAIEGLEQYAEAAQNGGQPAGKEPAFSFDRVVSALVEHHRAFYAQLRDADPPLNASRWGFARYEDGIAGIQWLVDAARGGRGAPGAADNSSFIWPLLHLLREESDAIMAGTNKSQGAGFTWEEWFEAGDPFSAHSEAEVTGTAHLLRHGVDIGQAMKLGPLWWRVSGADTDWRSAQTALDWAERYLHMADGMYFADENVGGSHTASRGTETCSIVETMNSMRVAYEITGNITFMDRLERLAFNSLPAALWPDVTANVYHHCSNQVEAAGNEYSYALYFCCTANLHQGWPKFVLSAAQYATTSAIGVGRLVVSGYAPSVSRLGSGLTLRVQGRYPFADSATIVVDKEQHDDGNQTNSLVDLALRVPCWTERASVSIGNAVPLTAPPCAFFNVSARLNEPVNVTFVHATRLYTWRVSKDDGQGEIEGGGVEVHRGPLLYALRPSSNVTEVAISGAPEGGGIKQRNVVATGAWNYALLVDSLQFHDDGDVVPVPAIPFDTEAPSPVRFTADARRVPSWKTAGGARGTGAVPKSPLNSSEPLEQIELVPFGSTNVRISVFPTLVS